MSGVGEKYCSTATQHNRPRAAHASAMLSQMPSEEQNVTMANDRRTALNKSNGQKLLTLPVDDSGMGLTRPKVSHDSGRRALLHSEQSSYGYHWNATP